MEALGYDTAVEEDTSPFEDVSGQYTYAINRALEMGIATLQAQFRPDEAITYAEALKMGAVAAGYETKCNLSGGYPVGVLAVAQETGLSDKVSPTAWNGAITPQQALTILYNTLTIDRMQQVSYGETYTYEVREGETLLYQYFQLYTVEGIVTANGRTSLTSADGKLESGRVSIGSRQYLASEEAQNLLGQSGTGLYSGDQRGDRAPDCGIYGKNGDRVAVHRLNFLPFPAIVWNLRRRKESGRAIP